MTARKAVASTAFLLFVCAVIVSPFVRGRFVTTAPLGGFGAFYCGGVAVRTGHDPYLVEPLRTCERALPLRPEPVTASVEPAPLPPFVLAPFALLSFLPFSWALATFLVLLVVGIGAAVWALQRLTGFRLEFIGAMLLVTALYHNMLFGEVPPLVIATLCVGAILIERGRCVWGTLVAAGSLIEPHVAAPVLIAMFIFLKSSRLPLALTAASLAAVSLVAVGPATAIEYFSQAVPLHALSEVAANDQYSLTWVLHEFGVGDTLAVRFGTISYIVASAAGIALAFRLARRYERPAFLLLVPALFAMVGGTFIHDIQLPIALPAALLMLAVSPRPLRGAILAGAALLALPWYDSKALLFGFPVLAILIWTMPGTLDTRRKVTIAVAACAAFACAMYLIHQLPSAVPPATPIHIAADAHENASIVWRRFVNATGYGQAGAKTIVLKLPLWLGLLSLAATAVALGTGVRAPCSWEGRPVSAAGRLVSSDPS